VQLRIKLREHFFYVISGKTSKAIQESATQDAQSGQTNAAPIYNIKADPRQPTIIYA